MTKVGSMNGYPLLQIQDGGDIMFNPDNDIVAMFDGWKEAPIRMVLKVVCVVVAEFSQTPIPFGRKAFLQSDPISIEIPDPVCFAKMQVPNAYSVPMILNASLYTNVTTNSTNNTNDTTAIDGVGATDTSGNETNETIFIPRFGHCRSQCRRDPRCAMVR